MASARAVLPPSPSAALPASRTPSSPPGRSRRPLVTTRLPGRSSGSRRCLPETTSDVDGGDDGGVDDGSASATPVSSSADETTRRAKADLWRTWWFEARNADALALLAKMPDADLDARTEARVEPRAKRLWIPGGETAAVLAAQRDDSESIAFLALAGADLDARDDNGAVAMHHAAFADAPRAVDALIAAGADPNAQDRRDGSTPAILAAYGSRREVLNRLIDAHPAVDLTLRDVGGATVAGHCAQRRLRDELLRILLLCGPGGAGGVRRGRKDFLARKRELTGQLETLTEEQLRELARGWRARTSEEDDKKTLVVKILQTTP